MPRFAYKAVDADGGVVAGEIEARDKPAAVALLRARGQMLIRAEDVAGRAPRAPGRPTRRGRRAIRDKDVAVATRALATLLQAGVPVDRALALTARGVGRSGLARVFEEVRASVRAGARLSDALAGQPAVFPPFYVGLVRAGETGGALAPVMARLADTLERTRALTDTVRSALTYPLIVLVFAAASILILLVAVVPEFRPLLETTGAALPVTTRGVLAASDALRAGWALMLAGVLGLLLGARQLSGHAGARRRVDRWALRLPVVGPLWRRQDAARFTRTLATLLGNGVGPVAGVELAARTASNHATAAALAAAPARVRRGDGLTAALASTGVLPEVAVYLIELGEQSGAVATMLQRVADDLDADVATQVQRGLALLVPVVTIGLGILVAAIVGSILSAILTTYRLPL